MNSINRFAVREKTKQPAQGRWLTPSWKLYSSGIQEVKGIGSYDPRVYAIDWK